ncbi:DNA alkylation repair protein [Sedimentitalea sp. JM2-8]|uniref:DNA alkylation repair protein n=1 Tax=Sedimentitalea xiamensis TaxID=3050037 RepID=A0ABT7FB74_9RHOB|nr:DNA alkylation repair protein [Sedimentitalea xiamensis]MDK3072361.1 DNA alkylation repair protein [Sedimentitalea xiamensis]
MIDRYLAQIREHADPDRAAGMAAYHKAERRYFGVANPVINELTLKWRQELDVADRVKLADLLWRTDIYEARLAAAKLLTQARIRPDDAAWGLIRSWAPEFDSWAIADHACMAGQKRLVANPVRLDEVEPWTGSDHMWTRRAALVITLPWTKQNNPKPEDLARRERILGWAAGYVPDRDWFIQKAIAWWLRDLSKHDAARVRAFLDTHGAGMKPFARKEAAKYLPRVETPGNSP